REGANTAACARRTRRSRGEGPRNTRAYHATPPPMPVPVAATVCNAMLCPPRALAAHGPRRSLSSRLPLLEHLSLSRLWYTGPPMKGGTTDGQCTVHRCAGAPHRVSGFDELAPCRVSAAGPALRGRVPGASCRVAPRWETADRPPVHGLQKLSAP